MCGHAVEPGHAHAPVERVEPDETATTDGDDRVDRIPWHLKLLAGALAVYLGYRTFQLFEWLAGKL